MTAKRKLPLKITPPIFDRVREILESARANVACTVNSTQVVANWLIGREIVEEQQQGKKRAGYGETLLANLAHRLGRITAERVQQHYDVVGGAYGLDTSLPDGLSPERLLELMGRDKKVLSDGLTFVLDSAAGVELVPGVAHADALAVLGAMR